jgi:hypothetical protein
MHVTGINEMREWSPVSEEAMRIAHLPGFLTLLFSACLLQQVAVRGSETSTDPLSGAKTSVPVFVMLPVFN